MTYSQNGQQIIDEHNRHVADCASEDIAAMIVHRANAFGAFVGSLDCYQMSSAAIASPNVHDDTVITMDMTIGELRKIDAELVHRANVHEALVEALDACRDQFKFYKEEHEKAGKTTKALTNAAFEEVCALALELAKVQP
jgi:hypothetical protein